MAVIHLRSCQNQPHQSGMNRGIGGQRSDDVLHPKGQRSASLLTDTAPNSRVVLPAYWPTITLHSTDTSDKVSLVKSLGGGRAAGFRVVSVEEHCWRRCSVSGSVTLTLEQQCSQCHSQCLVCAIYLVPVRAGQDSELTYSRQWTVSSLCAQIKCKHTVEFMVSSYFNIRDKMIKRAIREEQNQDHTHSLRSEGWLFFLLKEVWCSCWGEQSKKCFIKCGI